MENRNLSKKVLVSLLAMSCVYLGGTTAFQILEVASAGDIGKDITYTGTLSSGNYWGDNPLVSSATGTNAVSIGSSTTASGHYSTAIGALATASGDHSISFGQSTTASGVNSVAIGTNITASGHYSTAMGMWSAASGIGSTAIGYQVTASGNYSTAMGIVTVASGDASTAMGAATQAKGENSFASGNHTIANGDNSFSGGDHTIANGDSSFAFGNGAVAGVDGDPGVRNAVALGGNAQAILNNSVALGDMAVANTVHDASANADYNKWAGQNVYSVVSVGSEGFEKQVQHVAAGEVSATSTDAINGSQLYAVDQKVEKNTTDIADINKNIINYGNDIKNLDSKIGKVGANAAALAALHPLDFDPDAKWDVTAGYGNYDGNNAAALGAFYRPNEDVLFSVGATVGNGENMYNAGVSFKLGGNTHVTRSKVAMAKEIIDLRTQLAALSAQVGRLTGNLTSQTSDFPDVPQNHWAYEYVSKLCGNGIIEGYPDGYFKGQQAMTRYEMAAIIYRALTKGVTIESRALTEFKPELDRIRVDQISKNIERVRIIPGRG